MVTWVTFCGKGWETDGGMVIGTGLGLVGHNEFLTFFFVLRHIWQRNYTNTGGWEGEELSVFWW